MKSFVWSVFYFLCQCNFLKYKCFNAKSFLFQFNFSFSMPIVKATVQASYTKILGGRRKVIDTLISSEYRPTPQYVDLFLKDCFCSLKLAARKFGVQSYLTI